MQCNAMKKKKEKTNELLIYQESQRTLGLVVTKNFTNKGTAYP